MKMLVLDADFRKSSLMIDNKKRLWSQLVAAKKMIDIFEAQGPNAYNDSPNYRVWERYVDALKLYFNEMLDICIIIHGYKVKAYVPYELPEKIEMPPFTEDTFLSHQAFLIELDPDFYLPKFGEAANKFNGGSLIWEYYAVNRATGEEFLMKEDKNGIYKKEKQNFIK